MVNSNLKKDYSKMKQALSVTDKDFYDFLRQKVSGTKDFIDGSDITKLDWSKGGYKWYKIKETFIGVVFAHADNYSMRFVMEIAATDIDIYHVDLAKDDRLVFIANPFLFRKENGVYKDDYMAFGYEPQIIANKIGMDKRILKIVSEIVESGHKLCGDTVFYHDLKSFSIDLVKMANLRNNVFMNPLNGELLYCPIPFMKEVEHVIVYKEEMASKAETLRKRNKNSCYSDFELLSQAAENTGLFDNEYTVYQYNLSRYRNERERELGINHALPLMMKMNEV